MRNLCDRGKELTEAVNGESIRSTRLSRSLDTRPLRAFIITSICSFIACITVITCGGIISMRNGRLIFCHSNLLRALLPFDPSQSRRSTLVSSRSSSGISCPVFRRSCSSKTLFCLVKRSMTVVRICTCLSRAVGHGSSSWTLLVVAIDRMSTMQLFVKEALCCANSTPGLKSITVNKRKLNNKHTQRTQKFTWFGKLPTSTETTEKFPYKK